MAKKQKEDAIIVAERLKEVLSKSSDLDRSVAIEVCYEILGAYPNLSSLKSLKKLKRLIKKNSYNKVKIGFPAVKPSKERRKQIEGAVRSVVNAGRAKPSKKK